jgi:hypothetical protein
MGIGSTRIPEEKNVRYATNPETRCLGYRDIVAIAIKIRIVMGIKGGIMKE